MHSMNILTSIFIFLVAAAYVLIVNSFALTPFTLLRILVLPMILLLFILYRSSIASLKKFFQHRGKWLLLFWGTVFVHLLVLSTGGLQSPFLILIHLFMVGLSFIFGFTVSLLFLLFSFMVIFVDTALTQNVMKFIAENPTVIILQIVSLIPIVPVAYIISQQYRLKNALANILGTQVKTDQAILERLNELIIVTDPQFTILSVNDAVERALQKSRSEIVNTSLFRTLLLRNKEGKVINKEYFYPDGKTFQTLNAFISECTLINSSANQKKFNLLAQPIESADDQMTQISFILSYYSPNQDKNMIAISTDRARTKYEAMSKNLRDKFFKKGETEDLHQLVLMNNIESYIFTVQELKNIDMPNTLSRIDISQLCRQTVLLEQNFAQIFKTKLTFEILNFGWKDITPLTVDNYAIKPEQLTGPFFTVECDIQKVGLLIKKLLDMLIILSSSKVEKQVHMSVEQGTNKEVIIKIFSTCSTLAEEELSDIYLPYYGRLATKTNLQVGSGLEGYLIKTLSESLGLSLNMQYTTTTSTANISYTLILKKNFAS